MHHRGGKIFAPTAEELRTAQAQGRKPSNATLIEIRAEAKRARRTSQTAPQIRANKTAAGAPGSVWAVPSITEIETRQKAADKAAHAALRTELKKRQAKIADTETEYLREKLAHVTARVQGRHL